ncbi:hypothetical protein R0G64_32830, partial [Pseudomonas otitidis]|nr:hypothetical protein [Pseudomonas otitidis]
LLGRACLAARPNGGHRAIARLQALKPQCWVLTQNIDGGGEIGDGGVDLRREAALLASAQDGLGNVREASR